MPLHLLGLLRCPFHKVSVHSANFRSLVKSEWQRDLVFIAFTNCTLPRVLAQEILYPKRAFFIKIDPEISEEWGFRN